MIAQLGRVVVKTDVAHERFAQVDVTENKYIQSDHHGERFNLTYRLKFKAWHNFEPFCITSLRITIIQMVNLLNEKI
jgi:hypothetical protein